MSVRLVLDRNLCVCVQILYRLVDGVELGRIECRRQLNLNIKQSSIAMIDNRKQKQ